MFIQYSFPIIYAYISEFNGRLNNFFQGGNVGLFLTLCRLLQMQCKWMFTKHFTLSTPQRKCPMLWQQSQKMRFVGSHRYIMIIFTIGYLQIFKTEYFSQRSIAITTKTKPQIMILFYLARLVSVTQKQELQTSEISSKAINHSLQKTCLWLLCSVSVIPAKKLSMQKLNQFIGIKRLTSYFLETFYSYSEFPRGKMLVLRAWQILLLVLRAW